MKVNKHTNPILSGLRSTFLLSCLLILLQMTAFAQTVTVIGKVSLGTISGDLSGTTVQVKGTKGGVTTDADGHFSITVKTGATLVISHIGFKPQEVRASGGDEIRITLEGAENTLEQVTVSYGKQRKRDITGSVTKVDANSVQDVSATEFSQKLTGKVAGLQLNQTSGMPGQAMTMRIRGAASLGAGNQPLVVVDGQPISSDVTGGTGDLNMIPPDQIESFSVLKDAAATALYGSRAANGVIIITTKTGKIGRTSVSANAYYGWQSVPKRGRPDLMNAREFATFMKGYYEDKAKYETRPGDVPVAVPADYTNPDQYGAGTDWYSAVLRTAPIENYSVSVSSGNDKLSSSTTLNYFNQSGVLVNTAIRRFSFRSNNEYRPAKWVKLGLNLAPTYQIDYNTRGGNLGINGNRQVVSGAQISSPLISPYKADGTFTLRASSAGMIGLPNYLQQQTIMRNNQNNIHMLGNTYIDIEPISGLHAKTAVSGDLLTQDYNAYYGTNYGVFNSPPPIPLTSVSAVNISNNSYSWLIENTVDYAHSFGEHNLDVLVGYSTQKWSQNNRSITGVGFANDEVPFISGAATTSGTSNNATWTLISQLARVNYDYKKRYYISGTIRRDGSSRFGTFKKYATFPSVSAGWIASDESFFPKSDVVSFLKVKASYGLAGNNNIGNYTAITALSAANYIFNGATNLGEAINVLGNPNLTWETSKQTDVGIELNLLKDRITFSYDYYNKNTSDMLYPYPVPSASGYSFIQGNVGNFRIWGHEFTVSSRNLTGALTWTTDFNISFNDNKVISLVNRTPIGGTNRYNDYNRTAEGRRIGELYGYVFEGLYMTQADLDKYPKEATSTLGTARMRDVNKDDTINISDETFLGRTSPRYIFGMSNNFTYKNFDLGIVVSGQVGNKLMNTNLQNLHNLDGVFNVTKDMQNRWRSEADPGNGRVPRTLSNTTELYRLTNSTWVFSGDYLSVRNITLGYTLSAAMLRYIKGIRVYASAQNVFMFTRYPGQNPEVNDTKDNQTTAGTDNGSYPVPRTFLIGANINF
ncbi:MAG: TonB-dependent receptor [Chitinophagaceae bacterium]|nr:TonB-dependent receptor [Chitinophagaceae bacterium]